MAQQELITIFVALTAVAVVIQTGVVVGLYLMSAKMMAQADRAMATTRQLFPSIERAIDNLHDASARFDEYGTKGLTQLRELEDWWRRPAA